MSPEEAALVLSAYPAGTQVVASRPYRPGYKPYPRWASVRTPNGQTTRCVIKAANEETLLAREVSALKALTDTGLPVPLLLAGPMVISDDHGTRALIVTTELPGRPLPWLG